MAEPLTPEAEATMRERVRDTADAVGHPGCSELAALLATLDAEREANVGLVRQYGNGIAELRQINDALRASLDPDNPEAVEAWARYSMTAIGETWEPNQADLDDAAALLRARAEAERP